MTKFDWIVLIVFVIALLGGGILLPAYLVYYTILFKGFFSLASFIVIVFNVLVNYSVLNFFKKNFK